MAPTQDIDITHLQNPTICIESEGNSQVFYLKGTSKRFHSRERCKQWIQHLLWQQEEAQNPQPEELLQNPTICIESEGNSQVFYLKGTSKRFYSHESCRQWIQHLLWRQEEAQNAAITTTKRETSDPQPEEALSSMSPPLR